MFFGFTTNRITNLHLIKVQLNLKSTRIFFEKLRVQIQFAIAIVSYPGKLCEFIIWKATQWNDDNNMEQSLKKAM